MFSDDEADGDETATYCICNGPESTYMIACDHCEGWFHRRVSCLGEGDVALYKVHAEHIDNWYCPPCRAKDPSLAVTWLRTCRRKACNKPARVNDDPPSKYCSEECALEFFGEMLDQAPKGPEPSRGGAITQSEIALLANSVSTAAEFKALGKAAPKLRAKGKIVSKQYLRNMISGSSSAGADAENAGKVFENRAEYKDQKEKDADEATERRGLAQARQQREERYNQTYDGPPLGVVELREGLEIALGAVAGPTESNFMEIDWEYLQKHGAINPSEAQAIDELQSLMKYNAEWIGVLSFKDTFMKALHTHVEEILKSKGLDFKTTCGFLPQIAMDNFEFRAWLYTPDGSQITETGKYEPFDPSKAEEWRKKSEAAMCMHSPKKHAKHNRWYEVHEKENTHRRSQHNREFYEKLDELSELMSMLERRVYGDGWDGTTSPEPCGPDHS